MTKTALITGVSRNIGKAICKKFLNEGYYVIGTYNSSQENAEILKKENEKLELYQVDFCDDGALTQFIGKMKSKKFDVIVNNAGMMNFDGDEILHEFKNFNNEAFRNVMQCNFFAPLRICIELQDNINQDGSIVNIASTDGMVATYASLSYSASKAALINLSASLANNFYEKNKIRVNSLSPGWIESDEDGGMGSGADTPGGKAGVLCPMGRNGKTTEIADIVFALTQKSLFFINGANIVADGGFINHDVIYYEEATGKSLLKI